MPGSHDYLDALYGAMSATAQSAEARAIVAVGRPERRAPSELASYWSDVDIVHLNWPEHLVADRSPGCDGHLAGTMEVLDSLERSGALVVWTMHNRTPHFWPKTTGAQLYQRMASLAHVVIHHSEWGMREMLPVLAYRPEAIHSIIPHGHYEAILRVDSDRAACEQYFDLKPCSLRFGIIGRPQPQKRVSNIVRAFLAASDSKNQLLVTASVAGDVLPFDERVVVRPRSGWISRRELSLQIKCCDCLVAWHDEGHYLTSGLVADAIGAGIPMLVNGEWQFWREVLGEAALTYIGESGLKAAFANLTPGFIAQRGLAAAELRPKFDWSRIANETARLLLDTLSNRN